VHRIQCSEVFGGICNKDIEVCTSGINASLYSGASGGDKGGDIYYLSVCSSDLLTRIAIADVAGHGEAVSHVGRWLFESLTLRMNSRDNKEILGDLNCLVDQYGYNAITTAAVVAFYRKDYNLYFAYAGHPPVLVQRDGHEWKGITTHNPGRYANLPLGVDADTTYDEESLPLKKGDRIFLYTDGVLNAPDAGGNLFGSQRLLDVLNKNTHKSLTDLKQSVLDAMQCHTGGLLDHDDVTLLVVEVL
jgi:Serine phosphatase RsbU, regulator of sigma subunit